MHVHTVERAIRYIKEGVRSVHAGLPYNSPRAIYHHLLSCQIFVIITISVISIRKIFYRTFGIR